MNSPTDIGQAPDTNRIYIARQPIFDRRQQVFGYELLQRVGEGEVWDSDDDVVTLQVIRKAVLEFGLHGLAGQKQVFLNVGAGCLAKEEYLVFPPERTVLEVLERVEIDDALIQQVRRARELGYRIALDDYIGEARFDPLLAYVDIVKLDVLDRPAAELQLTLEHLANSAPRAELLAEKVESEASFAQLLEWPIQYFQGYFFKKPTTFEATSSIPTHQAALIRVTAALQSSEVSFNHLSSLISGVPRLVFQLLRLANSASFALPRTISTLHEAMIALGLGQLRRIVHILLATSGEAGPQEIGTLGLIRARICSQLARRDRGDEEAAFTVGLFSLMDVALRRPMGQILADVQLRADVEDALLNDRGVLSDYLRMAKSLEEGAPSDSLVGEASQLYLEAVAWAENLTTELLK